MISDIRIYAALAAVLRHAACWLSLISPKYNTRRCTNRPERSRRLSSTLQ